MALIKCPECGKEISDKASNCPNCGCPIEQKSKIEEPENKIEKNQIEEKIVMELEKQYL